MTQGQYNALSGKMCYHIECVLYAQLKHVEKCMPREAKKYKERGTPAAQQARAMAAHGRPTTPTSVMRGLKKQRIGVGGGGMTSFICSCRNKK